MTLKELRYLVALADKGNFVRAAESCYVGQSTLSTQIMKLEGYLGVKLFERGKHPVCLTSIGEQILDKARATLFYAVQIKLMARQYNDLTHGLVRVGSVPTLGPYLFPHLLSEVRSRFPGLNICPIEDLKECLLEQLRQGRLDSLLLPLPLQGDDLETMELFKEPFVIALPPNHVMVEKHQITSKDLKFEEVLILDKRHCMHDQVLAICIEHEIEHSEELMASSIVNLLNMVASGLGLSIIPQLATLRNFGSFYAGDVIIRPFEPPAPQRAIGLAWLKTSSRKSMLSSLAGLIGDRLTRALVMQENLIRSHPDAGEQTHQFTMPSYARLSQQDRDA